MSLFLLPTVVNTHNTDTNDIQTLLRPSESIIHRYILTSLQFKEYKLQFIDLKKFELKRSKNGAEVQDFVLFITNERLILYHINLRVGVYFYILGISGIENDKKSTKLSADDSFHDNKYTLVNNNKILIDFFKHEFFCGVCFFKMVIKSKMTDAQSSLEEGDCSHCGSHLAKDDMFLYNNTVVQETNDDVSHMICTKCTHDNSTYFKRKSKIRNNCAACDNPLLLIDIPILTEKVCIVLKSEEPLGEVIRQMVQNTKKTANLSKMNTSSMNLLKLLTSSEADPLEMGIKSIINRYDDDIQKLDFLHDVTLSTMQNFLESSREIDEYLHLSKNSQKAHITIDEFFIKNEYKVIKVNELYYLYNFEIFQYKYLNCQDFIDVINVSGLLQIYDYNNVSYVINKEFEQGYIASDYVSGNAEYDNVVKDKLSYDGYYLIDLDSSNKATYYFNNGN